MHHLNLQPKMVGRDQELDELQSYLDKAANGEGNTIFISGEAGIGKTRLVNEIKDIAESRGFQILSGYSMFESLTPYMPIMEAFKSGGLESLFAEESPRVEAVYLVSHSGLLITEVTRQKMGLDSDLFTSMLSTISNFVSESLSKMLREEKPGSLKSLRFEDYWILLERSKSVNIVLIISGRENEFLLDDIKEITMTLEENYESILKTWNGEEQIALEIEEFLSSLITSGKYDGTYYGKEDPKARRNLLFENVSLGLVRYVKTAPTLLCIEDLQWVDPSTLALMHYIARNTRKNNLLILGTYRPEDVSITTDGKTHHLIETMQLMNREDLYRKIELERLEEKNMVEMLNSLLSKSDFTDGFKEKLYKETEGNPFFIISLIRVLIEDGIIEKKDDIWILKKDLEDVSIPSGIHDIIARRINRVKEEGREILDYSAVIGEEFNPEILAHATRLDKIELLKQLRILEQRHRLIRSLETKYKFDHAKIKEIIYNKIPFSMRKEYHAIIAKSIENINKGKLGEVIEDLAFHYYNCGNKEKALLFLLKAAEKAKMQYSNGEAIGFLKQALEFQEDPQERIELYNSLGDIYELIGEYERGIESYLNAFSFAKGKTKAEIEAKIGIIYQFKGEYDESIRICTKALDSVIEKESREGALILRTLGLSYSDKGELEIAHKNFTQSLAISRKINDKSGIINSLIGLGEVFRAKGNNEMALESYKEGLIRSQEVGDQRGIVRSIFGIGSVYRGLDNANAIKYYGKALPIAKRIGDQETIARIWLMMADSHWALGEYDNGLEYGKKCYELSQKIGTYKRRKSKIKLGYYSGSLVYVPNVIGDIYYDKGNLDKALEWYNKGLDMCEKLGEKWVAAGYLNEIGVVHSARGELDMALEFAQKSLEICETFGDAIRAQYAHKNLGIIYSKRMEYNKALENFRNGLEESKKTKNTENTSDILHSIGNINLKLGKHKLALDYYKESLKMCSKIDFKRVMADNYCAIAEVHLKNGSLEKAKVYCGQGFDLSNKIIYRRGIAESRRIYGLIYTILENWEDSIRSFEESISILGDMGLKYEQGNSYQDFGMMWMKKGEFDKAIVNLNKACKMYREMNLKQDMENILILINKLKP